MSVCAHEMRVTFGCSLQIELSERRRLASMISATGRGLFLARSPLPIELDFGEIVQRGSIVRGRLVRSASNDNRRHRQRCLVFVLARLERDLLKWTADYSRNERTGGMDGGEGLTPPLCEVAAVGGGSVEPTRTSEFSKMILTDVSIGNKPTKTVASGEYVSKVLSSTSP